MTASFGAVYFAGFFPCWCYLFYFLLTSSDRSIFFFVPEPSVGSPNVFGIGYKIFVRLLTFTKESDIMEVGKRKPAGEIRNCEHSEMTIVNLFLFSFRFAVWVFLVFLWFFWKTAYLIQIQNTKRDKNVFYVLVSFVLSAASGYGLYPCYGHRRGRAEISLFYIRCCAVFRDQNWNCRWKLLSCKCRR